MPYFDRDFSAVGVQDASWLPAGLAALLIGMGPPETGPSLMSELDAGTHPRQEEPGRRVLSHLGVPWARLKPGPDHERREDHQRAARRDDQARRDGPDGRGRRGRAPRDRGVDPRPRRPHEAHVPVVAALDFRRSMDLLRHLLERRGEERLTREGLGIHFISPAAPKPAQPRAAAPLPPAPGAQDTVAAGPRVHRAGGRRTAGPLRTSRGLGPALSGTSLEWSHHREGRPRAGSLGTLPARPASDL